MTTEDQELIGSLRTEWKTEWDKYKSTLDGAHLEKANRIEADLNAKCEAATAALSKKYDDLDGKVRRFMEQHAQLPGGTIADRKTLGHAFTQSAEFKSGAGINLSRRDRIALTMDKTRIIEQKATITAGGSGFVIQPPRQGIFDTVPRYPLVMRSLLDVRPVTTNSVEYLTQTWTYGADYQVAEGDKKAEGNVTFAEKIAAIRTIAWFVKVSRQMMADVPFIQATIDDQLTYGVLKKEDHEILNGDNAAGHLHGLLPQAQALSGAPLTAGSNMMDVVMAAITQVGANGFAATDIVMNPADWGAMAVQKNSQGFYVLPAPQTTASRTLWGLPVTLTPEIPALTVLVGQFPATAAILDRETVTVDIAYENEDDFIRNLVCIRAEERIGFAVFNPTAYVKATRPPTALEAEAAEPSRKR